MIISPNVGHLKSRIAVLHDSDVSLFWGKYSIVLRKKRLTLSLIQWDLLSHSKAQTLLIRPRLYSCGCIDCHFCSWWIIDLIEFSPETGMTWQGILLTRKNPYQHSIEHLPLYLMSTIYHFPFPSVIHPSPSNHSLPFVFFLLPASEYSPILFCHPFFPTSVFSFMSLFLFPPFWI